jgi:hypothetical protein
MTKWKYAVLPALVVAAVALAGPIKVWSSGEILSAADINANFSHIHSLMVGGHGARLVDADVSATANIVHSKLATPVLIPKAVAATSNDCNVIGACATDYNQGFSSIAALSTTGSYRYTFATARPNTGYGIHIGTDANTVFVLCRVTSKTTSSFEFQCATSSSSTSLSTMTNSANRHAVAVYDNDP